MGIYTVGQAVRLYANFADVNGEPADPGAVTLTMKLPGGGIETFSGDALTHPALGFYLIDYVTTEAGWHYYRFAGTTPVIAADEGEFEVSRSKVLS